MPTHMIGELIALAKNCPKPDRWFSGILRLDGGRTITVSGRALLPVEVGMTLEFDADDDITYFNGKPQYRPVKGRYFTRVLTGRDEVVKYLSSDVFKGIGRQTALKIYNEFGLTTIPMLMNNMSAVKAKCGLTDAQVKALEEGLSAGLGAGVLLKAFPSMSVSTAQRILTKHKGRSLNALVSAIEANPYGFLHIGCKVSFGDTDKVALLDLKIDVAAQARLEMLVYDSLSEYMRDKHSTYLRFDKFDKWREFFNRYVIGGSHRNLLFPDALEGEPFMNGRGLYKRLWDLHLQYKLNMLTFTGFRKNSAGQDEIALYRNDVYAAEQILANGLSEASRDADPALAKRHSALKKLLRRYAKEQRLGSCTNEQLSAVENAFEHRLSFLSGGPGRGKTFTLKLLIEMWREIVDGDILLLAPTGKAVNRMKAQTGYGNAETVMRFTVMNGVDRKEGRFVDAFRNSVKNGISTLVIIDEASMMDFGTAANLWGYIDRCTMVFVGDKDQLPPIEPGPFFAEALTSAKTVTTVLHKNFRTQIPEINDNAEKILNGVMKLKYTPNFMCFPSDEEPAPGKTLSDAEEYILNFYKDHCADGAESSDILVLTPFANSRYRLSSSNLNKLLQESILGPNTGKTPVHWQTDDYGTYSEDFKVSTGISDSDGNIIRIGDRIMNIKNNMDASWQIFKDDRFGRKADEIRVTDGSNIGVFNGDMGTVLRIYSATADRPVSLLVALDDARSEAERAADPRPVKYVFVEAELDDRGIGKFSSWCLGYALSIHKAQGSEADHVIIALSEKGFRDQALRSLNTGSMPFLTRNLLYTAVTRARESVIILGSRHALEACIASPYEYTNVCLSRIVDEL